MTSVRIICVGTLREPGLAEVSREYVKRLGRFAKVEVVELKESRLASEPSAADIKRAVDKEGERVLEALRPYEKRGEYVFACDINGQSLDSQSFSRLIQGVVNSGSGCMAFMIGGSHGISRPALERADMRLSFSAMTFPHQLFRVMLLEQVYRSFKIMNGEKYHK